VTTDQFRQLYSQAHLERRRKIRRAYQLRQQNPAHPSLRFKKVHATLPIDSARVDLDWRAAGVLKDGTLNWFWVGSHQTYEALLRSL
jgi:ABC-type phosphonate transport system ATPase subunit